SKVGSGLYTDRYVCPVRARFDAGKACNFDWPVGLDAFPGRNPYQYRHGTVPKSGSMLQWIRGIGIQKDFVVKPLVSSAVSASFTAHLDDLKILEVFMYHQWLMNHVVLSGLVHFRRMQFLLTQVGIVHIRNVQPCLKAAFSSFESVFPAFIRGKCGE